MAYIHSNRLNVSAGRANFGKPAALEFRRGTRGRLRHWGRAALELRRVRRGSARIPLWGNPGSASTSKVPGSLVARLRALF
ncbi:hypothetical protein NDU88_007015 [Pleurodeles waltl]|uniref:Uncharacterized protein n=1 Tax=Pleurodeles waltl TaxID=8319 RepID=A0AAV7WGF8_PLEWA|nr:hypothetical protein NDU88_007015 [Pleurodeles waltl]